MDSLQEEIKRLKDENDFYKQNGPVGLYYELNRFVNGVVQLMRKTNVDKLLTPTKDEDPKKFEKIMALIKNAKEHTSDMAEMKTLLNLTGDEEKDKQKPFTDRMAADRK